MGSTENRCNASATVPTGHKAGIVGRNGAGKTSLFRLIRGEWALDSGSIEIPAQFRIGGVDQEAPASDISLLETVLAADAERQALMCEAETATDPNRIADIQLRLVDIDAYSAEARAATILSGLGFDQVAQARPATNFLVDGGCELRCRHCSHSPICCYWMSRPTISILRVRFG